MIDTSAITAVLFGEADAGAFEKAMVRADRQPMSAVTRVELSFVIEGRKGQAGRVDLEAFLRVLDPEIVAVSWDQADLAIEAFRRFGKGRQRAALNIGDCVAYALARYADAPLLFKGDDFVHTDLKAALVIWRRQGAP